MMSAAQGPLVAACSAMALVGAVRLGGGLYEATVLDRAWPARPDLIRPERRGVDRKAYWMPVNAVFELALVLALLASWTSPGPRAFVLAALVFHAAMRVWSFAYFIPIARRFELGALQTDLASAALRWVVLNRWRIALDILTLAASLLAVVAACGWSLLTWKP